MDLAECARIWKGGCIIRAGFLDRSVIHTCSSFFPPFPPFLSRPTPPTPPTPKPTTANSIRGAYARDEHLKNLLVDPDFAAELNAKQVCMQCGGVPV